MVKGIVIDCGADSGTLYLTDDLAFLRMLRANGEKAAAVLTEENRDADFSGIPYAVERPEEMEPDDLERLYRRLAGLPWNILETERCRLREMTVADVDRLYEIYADDSITRFMENLFESREEERRYAADYRRCVYEFYGYGIWIVEEKATGTVIGRAGLEPGERGVELGYVIARPWQGQGIASEVCRAVLAFAEREIDCRRVISRVQSQNDASVALLKKLGFRLTAETDPSGMAVYEYVVERSNCEGHQAGNIC